MDRKFLFIDEADGPQAEKAHEAISRMVTNVIVDGLRLEPPPMGELKVPFDDEIRGTINDFFFNVPVSHNDAWVDLLKGIYQDLFAPEIAHMFMSYYNQAGPWADMIDNHLEQYLGGLFDVTFYRVPHAVTIQNPALFKSEILKNHRKEVIN